MRDIGDFELLLNERPATVPLSRRWPARVALGVFAILSITLAAMLWRANRIEPHPLLRLSADLGPDAVDGSPSGSELVISPDGSRLAYMVRAPGGPTAIATRLLDRAEPAVLTGTEHGNRPFFSPDGQWLGFFAPAR